MTFIVNPPGTVIPSGGGRSTLLSLVQQACAEMGLAVPAAVVGNGSQDVGQILALLNAVGGDLQREYDWQFLSKEYRFTAQSLSTTGTLTAGSAVVTAIPSTSGLDSTYMVAGTGVNQDTYVASVGSSTQVTLTQAATTSGAAALTFGKTQYALPADYDRIVDNTQYDKSKRWQMLGPTTAQQWQLLKSSYISTGPRIRYRIMGGFLQIWPMVSTPEYLGFEYQSNGWVNPSGTPSAAFTADTDVCVFDDRLMIAGLKLYYFRAKGFDFSDYKRDFEAQKSIAKANDHGSPTLSMAPRLGELLIGIDQVPDTGYGS